jgi:hypothetical protein
VLFDETAIRELLGAFGVKIIKFDSLMQHVDNVISACTKIIHPGSGYRRAWPELKVLYVIPTLLNCLGFYIKSPSLSWQSTFLLSYRDVTLLSSKYGGIVCYGKTSRCANDCPVKIDFAEQSGTLGCVCLKVFGHLVTI